MLRLRNISKLRIAKRKNIDNPSLPLYTQPLTKRINHTVLDLRYDKIKKIGSSFVEVERDKSSNPRLFRASDVEWKVKVVA